MTSEGLGEMFEGDSVDMCAGKFLLMLTVGFKRNHVIRNRNETRKLKTLKFRNRNETKKSFFLMLRTETENRNETKNFRPKSLFKPGNSWFNQAFLVLPRI